MICKKCTEKLDFFSKMFEQKMEVQYVWVGRDVHIHELGAVVPICEMEIK